MTEPKPIEATRASESSHWYDLATGEPRYTMIGKNGEERPITLRDVKKFRKEGIILVPGFTSISQCANKPALINWFQEQAIMAALTLPKIEGESDTDYINRIKQDAGERAKKARERGTQIHEWVQKGFELEELTGESLDFYDAAAMEIISKIGYLKWNCEMSFSHPMGYGGKCDMHSFNNPDSLVLDIKTTDKPLDTLKLWDDHYMQLAAYREGLNLPSAKCGILYVNSVTPEARLVWAEEKDLIKGWNKFQALLKYWYYDKGLEIIEKGE